MEYIFKETKLSSKYQNIYMDARKNKQEKLCFVGLDKNYQMTTKDSFYNNITDMDVMLELCIYPLYLKGFIEIKDEIQEIIEKMASSNDVLQVFQVFNLIMSQEIEMKMYSNVPFQIEFSKVIESLFSKKSELEEQMKNYRENGFERFNESIWDCIERICRKSLTLKEYTSL